jgi:hypothetical protein
MNQFGLIEHLFLALTTFEENSSSIIMSLFAEDEKHKKLSAETLIIIARVSFPNSNDIGSRIFFGSFKVTTIVSRSCCSMQ